jgi:glycosyltransferase involved in cell wall biosynthesis
MRPELEAAAQGLGGAVRLHGIVPNAGRMFPAFDAFVLSSRTEGTPMVLFEAMSVGVPIVAAAVGGVPDVIDSRTAVLVPPNDAQALADGIRAVREDREGAAVRAREARARLLERFSEGPWIEAYGRVYDSVRRVRAPGSVRR